MAVTASMFAKFPLTLMTDKTFDISASVMCALVSASHAPAQATDQYWDASHGMYEVPTANGYTAGGVAVTSATAVTSALVTKIDSADPSWTVTGAGFTYRYAIFYRDTAAANKPLISFVNFGADVTAVAGTHTIVLDSNGIARITVT